MHHRGRRQEPLGKPFIEAPSLEESDLPASEPISEPAVARPIPASRFRSTVKVLHIAGLPRTGSTVLANVLGQIDGYFTAGELMGLGQALVEGNLCGCGVPVAECRTWGPILAEAFGGTRTAIERLRDEGSWLRARDLPRLVLKRRRGDADLAAYQQALAALFLAVERQSQARVVVEASKRPTFGWILGSTPRVELYTVHLVRDPRATWDSWVRARQWEHSGPLQMGATWGLWHAAVALDAGRRPGRYLALRYEDFVSDPRGATRSIAAFVGETGGALPFADDHTVRLEATHSVHGNANRFRIGEVPLVSDDGWQTRLDSREKLLTMAASWPVRRRWSYALRAEEPRGVE